MRNRVILLLNAIGMILITIGYLIVNIFFWVVLVIGSLFWSNEVFIKMVNNFWKHLPQVPDEWDDDDLG